MDGSQGALKAGELEGARLTRRTRLYSIAQSSAMALAAPAVVSLCLWPTGSNAWALIGLYGLALLPSILTTSYLALRRHVALVRAHALFSLLAVAGGYSLLLAARVRGVVFNDLATFALLSLAQVPAFALLLGIARRSVQELGKPVLPVLLVGVVGMGTLIALALLSLADGVRSDMAIAPPTLCALYVLSLGPPFMANFIQARREKRIPAAKSDKQPNHISGIAASALITFAIVVVTLGLWAAWSGATALIDGMAGLVVIFGLAAAFLVLAVGPFLPVSGAMEKLLQAVRGIVRPLGDLFSWADSLLVFPVAGSLGATQSRWGRRYLLLLGNIIPCGVLGWWLAPPFGLVPLFASLAGTIAIARRWAWVEEDRENAMLNRRFEGDHIRVGFGQDLRDETLIAFMTLLFLVPLALRQLYVWIGPDTFNVDGVVGPDRYDAWLSFFGTELAKALPFVDWAEVYHVQGAAPIELDDQKITAGNHIIFATRILVDLVLLAALLQAISIAHRTFKLKNMFFKEQTIDQLDPFLEGSALSKLARRVPGGFEMIDKGVEAFPRYNEDRLEALKLRGPSDQLGYVASELLDRYSTGGPAEQLVAEAKRPRPDRERLDELIAQLKDEEKAAVGPLKAAHFKLNSLISMWPIRVGLTEIIAREVTTNPSDLQGLNALSEILIGPNTSVMDPRREARLEAANGLRAAALGGQPVAMAALIRAAENDASSRVKRRATEILEEVRKLRRENGDKE